MKTFKRMKGLAGIISLVPLVLLRAATPVVPSPNPQPAGAEPKTHTLFMGTDIVVERNKQLGRVADVIGSSFVVTLDGAPVTVPMGGGSHKLKVEQSMKLTSASALLTGLKGERAYTPGNDPRMRRQKEQMAVTVALEDAASLAMGKYTVAQNDLARLSAMPQGDSRAGAAGAAGAAAAIEDAQKRADTAFKANEMASLQMSTDLASGSGARSRAGSDLAQENFDAIEVSFEVSSEVPLTKPYLVAVTQFRPRNAPPGMTANNAIYAKELRPIGREPQRVTFTQGGFPWGFTLDGYEVHLYDHGIEIATNVAPNRVALTREEAFLYLKIEYLSKHKGDTLPASLAMKRVNLGSRATPAANQSTGLFFVKVSKEGMPLATFTDEACSLPADPSIQTVAAYFRFFPALEKGKEVGGVAKVVVALPES